MNAAALILPSVVAILTAAAGAVGFFKANVSKSTIALYREDNQALRARLSTLEAQVKEDAIRIEALEHTRAVLTGIVTQADAIADIRETTKKIARTVGAA